jgi:ketosteroid isomerase-like protein
LSARNLELHRKAIEAINRRDVETFVSVTDPDVEGTSAASAAVGVTFRGRDGMRAYFRDLEDAWGTEFRVLPEAFVDLGERTLMFHMLHGRGRRSGADVTMPIATVVRWRNGLAIHWKSCAQRQEALDEAGVSEDALERIA